MTLLVYTTGAGDQIKHFVGLQDPEFLLPTRLACPMLPLDDRRTPLSVDVTWNDDRYHVRCDLARAQKNLSHVGELDEEDSTNIMALFLELLAR